MRKISLAVLCMIAILILYACKKDGEVINNTITIPDCPTDIARQVSTSYPVPSQTNISDQITPLEKDNKSLSPTPTAMPSDTDGYEIIRDGYNKGKEIVIGYPRIKGLKDTDKQNAINNLLKQDAMSYLDNSSEQMTVDISYEIEWKGKDILSVGFYGWGENSDSSHPFKGYFTTNIDMRTGKKVNLKDVLHIDQTIVDSIKENSSYEGPLDPSDPNLMEEVQRNIGDLNVSSLNDISFYFTWNSFGIIIDVSHAQGGYARIETKYSNLISSMKSENNVWKEFEGFKGNPSGIISNQYWYKNISELYKFTIIEEQSFNVDLNGWGNVRFVSGKDYQGKLLFFLTDEKNNIEYQFSDYYNSYRKDQTVSAVAFRDVNKDSLKDVIIVTAGDREFTACDIYFQDEYGYFFQAPDLYHELNESNREYDAVSKIMDYMNKTGFKSKSQ